MPDHKCYACTHVLTGGRPALYACREDGDLILACGADDHEETIDDWKVVHPQHLIDGDETLREVVGLRNGEQAVRTAVGSGWKQAPISD